LAGAVSILAKTIETVCFSGQATALSSGLDAMAIPHHAKAATVATAMTFFLMEVPFERESWKKRRTYGPTG
jgi:hypothetical protein